MARDAELTAAPVANRPTWLTRNLVVLSLVSLFQDAASELVYPVLPIFLTTTLGAPAAVVGLVEGVAEGCAAITKIFAGRLSDRRSRRGLIGLGYGAATVGKLIIALAFIWPVVLVGRVVDRLGKGVRGAPRDALLVADIPPSAYGRAFGLHRSADTAGAVIGPLLGLAAYEAFGHNIRPLLWVAVIPALVSTALTGVVRDARGRPAAAPTKPARGARFASPEGLPAPYRRVLVLVTVFSLANFPDALLMLRLHDLGWSLVAVIGGYVTYNVCYALLSYPAGAVSDRLQPKYVFSAGIACFSIGYVGLGLLDKHNSGLAWLLLVVYGGFTALTDGVSKAWVSRLVPAERRGGAQGTFQGATGAAVLVAGIWAGLVWGDAGRLPLLVSGVAAALVGVLVLVLGPRTRPA